MSRAICCLVQLLFGEQLATQPCFLSLFSNGYNHITIGVAVAQWLEWAVQYLKGWQFDSLSRCCQVRFSPRGIATK